jgi:hypothetical protein
MGRVVEEWVAPFGRCAWYNFKKQKILLLSHRAAHRTTPSAQARHDDVPCRHKHEIERAVMCLGRAKKFVHRSGPSGTAVWTAVASRHHPNCSILRPPRAQPRPSPHTTAVVTQQADMSAVPSSQAKGPICTARGRPSGKRVEDCEERGRSVLSLYIAVSVWTTDVDVCHLHRYNKIYAIRTYL